MPVLRNEVVITATGELSAEEAKAISQVLGYIGLTTEIINKTPPQQPRSEPAFEKQKIFSINEVNSSEAFLVKEHFLDWRAKYAAHLSVISTSQAFGHLVNRHRYGVWPITPEDMGLVVKDRTEVGFPLADVQEYRTDTNRYAIQAGSFVRAVETEGNGTWHRVPFMGVKKREIFMSIGEFLRPRIVAYTET